MLSPGELPTQFLITSLHLHTHTLTPSPIQSVLSFSLPYPLSDLDYATYPHQLTSSAESTQRLLPGLELFSDPHRCDPPSLLSSLHWCSQELVTRNHPVKVLLYEMKGDGEKKGEGGRIVVSLGVRHTA